MNPSANGLPRTPPRGCFGSTRSSAHRLSASTMVVDSCQTVAALYSNGYSSMPAASRLSITKQSCVSARVVLSNASASSCAATGRSREGTMTTRSGIDRPCFVCRPAPLAAESERRAGLRVCWLRLVVELLGLLDDVRQVGAVMVDRDGVCGVADVHLAHDPLTGSGFHGAGLTARCCQYCCSPSQIGFAWVVGTPVCTYTGISSAFARTQKDRSSAMRWPVVGLIRRSYQFPNLGSSMRAAAIFSKTLRWMSTQAEPVPWQRTSVCAG